MSFFGGFAPGRPCPSPPLPRPLPLPSFPFFSLSYKIKNDGQGDAKRIKTSRLKTTTAKLARPPPPPPSPLRRGLTARRFSVFLRRRGLHHENQLQARLKFVCYLTSAKTKWGAKCAWGWLCNRLGALDTQSGTHTQGSCLRGKRGPR